MEKRAHCGNRADGDAQATSEPDALPRAPANRWNTAWLGYVRACSACAGDYEDPDRTAWPAGDEDTAECDVEDEFPGDGSQ